MRRRLRKASELEENWELERPPGEVQGPCPQGGWAGAWLSLWPDGSTRGVSRGMVQSPLPQGVLEEDLWGGGRVDAVGVDPRVQAVPCAHQAATPVP